MKECGYGMPKHKNVLVSTIGAYSSDNVTTKKQTSSEREREKEILTKKERARDRKSEEEKETFYQFSVFLRVRDVKLF
jgi:hypothetical protein